jgi:hypothetical protein
MSVVKLEEPCIASPYTDTTPSIKPLGEKKFNQKLKFI